MIKAKKICKLGQYKISGEIEMLWDGMCKCVASMWKGKKGVACNM